MTVRLLAVVDRGAALPAGLELLPLGGLGLAVAGGAGAPASVEELRAHDAAVRAIAGCTGALLPASFGVAAPAEDLLARLVPREAELRAALEQVRGREQMTVRVLGPAAPRPASGAAYLQARAELPGLGLLRELAGDLVHGQRARRGPEPHALASVYHLVPRGQAAAYAARVGTGTAELQFRVRGPFPPYAFAEGQP